MPEFLDLKKIAILKYLTPLSRCLCLYVHILYYKHDSTIELLEKVDIAYKNATAKIPFLQAKNGPSNRFA